jgi:hypothetical protein
MLCSWQKSGFSRHEDVLTLINFSKIVISVPVIIWATVIVSKGSKIYGNNTRTTLNRFPTKTAILGT